MLGDNIRKYRELNHLSQDELSTKLGVKRATISSWEVGRTEPNMGILEKMSAIFGISKAELIDGRMPNDYVLYENNVFSEEEKLIIEAYKGASSVNRIKALAILLGKEL